MFAKPRENCRFFLANACAEVKKQKGQSEDWLNCLILLVEAGRFELPKGRKEDVKRNAAILEMLSKGVSWNNIVEQTGCSRSTLSRLASRLKEAP
jgi:DNA invertase Pin-like site-specific DNA recombinase